MNLTKFKSRIINVSLSTANPTKRQETTIINRDTESKSTSLPNDAEQSNGRQQSPNPDVPSSSDYSSNHPTKATIQSKTLALLNIPDTVNSARIRSIMEPYGPLVKIILRPDHQGAIIEYAQTQDAGKAALGIEGYEIVPGRTIRVGTVKELLEMKEEVKKEKGVFGSGKEKEKEKEQTKTVGRFGSSGIVKRPTLNSGMERGGRRGRGGLGRRRGIGGFIPRGRNSLDENEKEKGKEKGKEKEAKEEEEGGDTVMSEYDDTADTAMDKRGDDNNNHNNNHHHHQTGVVIEEDITEGGGAKEQQIKSSKPAKGKGKSNADFKALFLGAAGEK